MSEIPTGTLLIIALVFMNGIVLFFCLGLEIFKRIFLVYGETMLAVNSREPTPVQGGETLISAMREAELFPPAACGGRGTCGSCRVVVGSGGGPLAPAEQILLSHEEIGSRVRLSCQVKVREDISVNVPSEWLSIRRYKGILAGIEQPTPRLKKLFLKLNEPLDFEPGQFIQVEYETGYERVVRAYSIASSPALKRELELNILGIPGGVVSGWLHRLERGEEISFTWPYGDMVFSER